MRYIIFAVALLMFCPAIYASDGPQNLTPEYRLSVSFDIPNSKIRGNAKIPVVEGIDLVFHTATLSILDVTLNGRRIAFDNNGDAIKIRTHEKGSLEIVYEGTYNKHQIHNSENGLADNEISEQGVSLTSTWYPRPQVLMTYRLTVMLPDGWQAIAEAEHIESGLKGKKREFAFVFDHPLDHMTFAASNRYRVLRDRSGTIELYAYFFEEDMELAEQYIGYAKKYLDLYQKMIGLYPYSRFSIVENVLPTGYSMPTFTLLGRDVVRLPFIVETSLGHEILHQWFGDSVYIDYEKGNWAEGLTTYMADYYYEDQKGRGADYRKQILIDYQSYVNKDNVFPLRDFRGRTDSSSKSIGYGKAAMLFHMLRKEIGDEKFYKALRDFVGNNSFKKASWDDLRASFEAASGVRISNFLSQWVDRTAIADLKTGSAAVRQDGDGYKITFDLRQTGKPFSLVVPVAVYAAGKKETIPVKVDKESSEITLYSGELPDRIVVDEDYDVMRRLSYEEIPPVIARLLGEKGLVVILPPANKEAYEIMIDAFRKMGASIKETATADDAHGAKSSLIIFGNDNPMLEGLRGVPRNEMNSGGFTISIYKNPFNPEKVIAVINSMSAEETNAAFPKIFHYGKYSRLAFDKGRNILKETAQSKKGLIVEIEADTPAVHMPDIKNLSQVIDSVQSKRIVYVGEEHTNYAHHSVQLEVIKRFFGQGGKIAIGMEMFQKPFQAVLDDYVKGTIDQKTFLKKTQYFTRWGFDYDLYKPIVDYAMEHRIPLIALNINREIVEMVSKNGLAELPAEMKAKVPPDMDLSDERYKDRLKKIFAEHDSIKDRNFDFFFQAQVLWDETMSQTVSDYLSTHPDYRMIVLAGNGHLMYGSGIPNRAFRRSGLSYAVILSDAEMDKDVADYVVFPRHIEGPQPVRVMVILKEDKGIVTITGFPEHSISKKVGLSEGDIIRSIDAVPVAAIDDVKIYLLGKKKGDTLSIRILRKAAGSPEQEIKFDVTL